MLVGYGLVVGLNRTGDSQQTYFTVQTLANAMQKMGVLIAPGTVEVKNVAAVFITASLPPFARPGAPARCYRLVRRRCQEPGRRSAADERVARARRPDLRGSAGPAGDGRLYRQATARTARKSIRRPSASFPMAASLNATLPSICTISRPFHCCCATLTSPPPSRLPTPSMQDFHKPVAAALDSTRVDVNVADAGADSVPVLISRVQNLSLSVFTRRPRS